jgi:hypothetical protein
MKLGTAQRLPGPARNHGRGQEHGLKAQKAFLHQWLDLGKSLVTIAQENASWPASTLSHWKTHFQQYGETKAETAAWRSGQRNPTCRRPTKVTAPLLRALQALVHAEPELYLDEIAARLERRFGACRVPSETTLWRTLVGPAIGYTLTIATRRARERNNLERQRHVERLANIQDPAMLCFLDETAKDRAAARRRRAWHRRGTDNVIDERFMGKTVRYTMLAAVDLNGFVVPACTCVHRPSPQDEPSHYAMNIDADRFVAWVETDLCPFLGDFSKQEARSVVVCDNASIHNDPRFAALIEARGAILVYGAAYSPDMNPIE